MHIHILGICGTFMGSLAQLAKGLGHRVTGSDVNVYPPMSTQLEMAGIELTEGVGLEQLVPAPDKVVVGNVMSRGHPLIEAVLNRGIPYTSGPQWLAEHVLQGRWVLAVSGTHGKTTTATMLAWILEYAGLAPGYLIGGVPGNFSSSARLGGTDFFVIEADEYDTAFFDKRSKFVHYRPRTLVINNLEFDHADIFPDLAAIQTQFHHLLRTVPEQGRVIAPAQVEAIDAVLERGCWSEVERSGGSMGAAWQVSSSGDGSRFDVLFNGEKLGAVHWSLSGQHNVANGLHAIAAARHVGVLPEQACAALSAFEGVKRRMECIGQKGNITLYDDFAHHPTAIATTLAGLRAKVGDATILAIVEPRSNTMKQGVHKDSLSASAADADGVLWREPEVCGWSMASALADEKHRIFKDTCAIVAYVETYLASRYLAEGSLAEGSLAEGSEAQGIHIVVMSNGGFDNIHTQLISLLDAL